MIIAIFLNLGTRTGGYSAYSVFNQGQRHLLGDLRAEQVDREYRGIAHMGGNQPAEEENNVVQYEGPEAPVVYVKSRDQNKECYCGSTLRYKKCCGAKKPRPAPEVVEDEPSKPIIDDDEYAQWKDLMTVTSSGKR
eukprot:GEMP01081550.1.p1 GENE.GEMP01081550.1~~GEMP01081550.1.p1  ORF type:complete len:136 (+),score=28.66 GEMP01081550.1:190-597(+)